MILNSQLLTPRLAVRPFAEADIPLLVELFADPLVRRFVDEGQPLKREMAALWVSRSLENLRRHGYGTGAVVELATGEMIGWAGFARPGDGTEEIIFGFAREHWRKGFGRELVGALVGFAHQKGMSSVRATIDPDNVASLALLSEAGFRLAERGHGGDARSDLYLYRARPVSAEDQMGSSPK